MQGGVCLMMAGECACGCRAAVIGPSQRVSGTTHSERFWKLRTVLAQTEEASDLHERQTTGLTNVRSGMAGSKSPTP